MAERQLSLHGLWPQPRGNDYCGVPEDVKAVDKARAWGDLPALVLTDETRRELARSMPGVESFLHRHEWIKHGTCYFAAGDSEEYFSDSLQLTETVNRSSVGAFLSMQIGRTISTPEIRLRFDEAFGAGAGDRVSFVCKKDGARTLIQEIRINLVGEVRPSVPLGDLIQAAAPLPIGCRSGTIDPAGLQ